MSRAPVRRLEGDLLLATGAILAGAGVAAGALGAHLLQQQLSPHEIDLWRTAANYQMYHALAIIIVARILSRHPTRLFRISCGCFIVGIMLFSGSLYGAALTGADVLGVITPLGGIAFLGGWVCLAAGIFRSDRT